MNLLTKKIQLEKMAASRRYTAELLAFIDDESDISESETDEEYSEGSESTEDETVIDTPIPLEEIAFQASPSSPD